MYRFILYFCSTNDTIMRKYSYCSICIILLFTGRLFGQNPKKTLLTQPTQEKIVIDGKFDEKVWSTANVAADFLMISPDNGKVIAPEKKTEVRVVYDNEAIYIAAK